MEIKDIQPNQGNIDLVLTITEKGDIRTFEKFGNTGRVCKAKAKDESGEITLTLWNEDIDKVGNGDKIHLQNGWCSEYQGEKQLSSGKFGKIEIVEKSNEPQEVVTNDPSVLAQQAGAQEMGGESEEEAEEDAGPVQEEESVE